MELASVFESFVGGLVVFARDGEIACMNSRAEEILGVRREEVRSAAELFAHAGPEDERGRRVTLPDLPFARAISGEVVDDALLVLRHPDGSRRWVLASAAPVVEQREVAAVVVGFTDVSARHAGGEIGAAAARASRRRAAHAEPSYTPVPGAGTQGGDCNLFRCAARLGRLESGSIAVELEAVDMRGSVLDLLERLRPTAGVHRVLVDLPPETPWALADSDHVHTMVAHLLDNAFKYATPGSAIVVACRRKGGQVVVEVRDEGPGIPSAELPRLFDRFFRGSTAGRIEGLGLGLHVVQRLAEAQGGRATVASEPGKGSTFAIELPAFAGR
jgi:PAS domain S-box-containing protein